MAFAEWGIDWVKIDNCDYGSWADLIESQRAMSKAIQATKRPMIIQLGAGDHMPLLNNPHSVSGGDGYARTFADQAWMWGPDIAHTWYTGSDKHNTWESTLNNVLQNYRGAQYFQKPGAWNFAGDLWYMKSRTGHGPPPRICSTTHDRLLRPPEKGLGPEATHQWPARCGSRLLSLSADVRY